LLDRDPTPAGRPGQTGRVALAVLPYDQRTPATYGPVSCGQAAFQGLIKVQPRANRFTKATHTTFGSPKPAIEADVCRGPCSASSAARTLPTIWWLHAANPSATGAATDRGRPRRTSCRCLPTGVLGVSCGQAARRGEGARAPASSVLNRHDRRFGRTCPDGEGSSMVKGGPATAWSEKRLPSRETRGFREIIDVGPGGRTVRRSRRRKLSGWRSFGMVVGFDGRREPFAGTRTEQRSPKPAVRGSCGRHMFRRPTGC